MRPLHFALAAAASSAMSMASAQTLDLTYRAVLTDVVVPLQSSPFSGASPGAVLQVDGTITGPGQLGSSGTGTDTFDLAPGPTILFDSSLQLADPSAPATITSVNTPAQDSLIVSLAGAGGIAIELAAVDASAQVLDDVDLFVNGSTSILASDLTNGAVTVTDAQGGLLVFDVTVIIVTAPAPIPIGDVYCTAVPNSSGSRATLQAFGSLSATANDVTLTTTGLPANVFGIYLVSDVAETVVFPGGSQGVLCLGGDIGRYSLPGEILSSGAGGEFSFGIDTQAIRRPATNMAAVAGETYRFQGWHRDVVQGAITSNFTDAISITFQ